jgi:hypothetical protein
MHKKMTITLNEDVYDALHQVIGRGKISQFLEKLARPYVLQEKSLDAGYQAMAADKEREAEASEWCNALISDVANETR